MRAWSGDSGDGLTQTEHPLRVEVWPMRSLAVGMTYYCASFETTHVTRMLSDLRRVLEGMVASPHQPLGALLARVRDVARVGAASLPEDALRPEGRD